MSSDQSRLPSRPKIETDRVPVEWLHDLALREGNYRKPIYWIHKWWARRLGSVFRTLLILAMSPSARRVDRICAEFYERHDYAGLTVLDPFMGGGTSIVEACKCGAAAIGVDIDPVAWFITKKEIEPCPFEAVEEALQQLDESVGAEIRSYYVTRTPQGRLAPVIYYFWVDLMDCPNCGARFEAHLHYQISRDRKTRLQTVFCKACHALASIPLSDRELVCSVCEETTVVAEGTVRRGRFECPECSHTGAVISLVGSDGPFPKRLFAVEYEEDGQGSRRYKPADEYDLRLFQQAEGTFEDRKAALPFPREEIPIEGRSDSRPISHGYRYYYQLFNARQLLCLSLLYREITKISDDQVREYLLIAFSDALSSNNMLCFYAFDYRKLTPLFGLHAFNVVNRAVENSVWGGATKYGRGTFVKCAAKMLRGKDYAEKPYETRYDRGKPTRSYTGEKVTATVTANAEEWYGGEAQTLLLNRSSTDLHNLKGESVDLVLTDPPYYDNLSYSELSDFFYVWLRDHLPNEGIHPRATCTPYRRALYAVGNDDPSHRRFVRDLTQVFAQCKRVLRPRGMMVFTFHHRDVEAWDALARALYVAGFTVTNVFPVRSEGKSGFHSTAGTIKWDSVLVCRPAKGHSSQGLPSRRSFLRSVRTRLSSWERRLQEANLDFGWPDSVSLGYGLAVQGAILRADSEEDVTLLLHSAAKLLVARVAPILG